MINSSSSSYSSSFFFFSKCVFFSGGEDEWRRSFSERETYTVKKSKTGCTVPCSQTNSFGPHQISCWHFFLFHSFQNSFELSAYSGELPTFLTIIFQLRPQRDCVRGILIKFGGERLTSTQPKSQRLWTTGNSNQTSENLLSMFPKYRMLVLTGMLSLLSRILVATWNVGGKSPPNCLNLEDWLHVSPPADIYVLGYIPPPPLYIYY